MDPLQWIRIDVGYQDPKSFDILTKYAATYSSSSPVCIGLVGDLKSDCVLAKNPDIQAIIRNTLSCYVLNRNPSDLNYLPTSTVSVYNRLGTEVFYIRIAGRNPDVLENAERPEFVPEVYPADEIELDLAEMDSEYSRLLLFVFHMSHTIFWFQSDSVFSNYDLRLMKVVDLARLRGQKLISKTIAEVTENKDWIREGTICCPRLIFVFSGLPRSLTNPNDSEQPLLRDIEKLSFEQDVSARLYTLLKKCRLISIPRSSGMCFVHAKKGLVISVPRVGQLDYNGTSFPNYLLDLDKKRTIGEIFGSWPKTENSATKSFHAVLKETTEDILRSTSISAAAKPAGFPWPSHFCKPSIAEWLAAALRLHSVLYSSEEYRSLLDGKLGCTMSISRKYSKSVAAFSANSFALQTSDSTFPQIQNCLHSYMQFARGPAAKDFGASLVTYLADNGLDRRQCSAQTLFGSRCSRTIHNTPGQKKKLQNEDDHHNLPVVYHQTRTLMTSFCSCGKSADQRPEPFNVREANEIFYENMDFKCCNLLNNRIDFPSLTVTRKEKRPKEEKKVETVTIKRYDSFPELSTAMQLNEKEISQPFIVVVVAEPDSERIPKKEMRAPSMFQLGMSLDDVVPRFSSWVLYGLGPADIYRVAPGLENHIQADFLNLHHHLLPVDAEIVLTRTHKLVKRVPNKLPQTQIIEPRPWHAKIFFGLDYECPRGHRFMYKSQEVSDLRKKDDEDAAQEITEEILNHGAPIFMRCPCKSPKDNRQFIAQLMRIHVITPKEPMKLGLLPKVKISRGVPAFTPGIEEPQLLDGDKYWVMRLPFCYYDSERGKGPFCAPRMSYPKHRRLPCAGNLMGGFLRFFESQADV